MMPFLDDITLLTAEQIEDYKSRIIKHNTGDTRRIISIGKPLYAIHNMECNGSGFAQEAWWECYQNVCLPVIPYVIELKSNNTSVLLCTLIGEPCRHFILLYASQNDTGLIRFGFEERFRRATPLEIFHHRIMLHGQNKSRFKV